MPTGLLTTLTDRMQPEFVTIVQPRSRPTPLSSNPALVQPRSRDVPLDLGKISALNRNADGSVSLHFGPKPPAGQEANWISTVAGKGCCPFFRCYSQEWPHFEKAWKLPDIENLK